MDGCKIFEQINVAASAEKIKSLSLGALARLHSYDGYKVEWDLEWFHRIPVYWKSLSAGKYHPRGNLLLLEKGNPWWFKCEDWRSQWNWLYNMTSWIARSNVQCTKDRFWSKIKWAIETTFLNDFWRKKKELSNWVVVMTKICRRHICWQQ